MITLTKLRDLDLGAPIAPGRPSYLSAASGLVRIDGVLYVVADDEHHLGIFDHDGAGALLELIEGELPLEQKARKKAKPDFEALVRLPAFPGYAHGALLASGSGSKPNRRKGALIRLTEAGQLPHNVHIVDLDWLMEPLLAEFEKVNLEGMAVSKDELCVFQRGNKSHKRNAVIRFHLREALEALAEGRAAALTPVGCRDYDLGNVGDVPLTFTDAAALPDGGFIFSAAAEDTDDAYADGACGGAALGHIDANGELIWITRIGEAHKIEGVDASLDGDVLRLLLVTDADNIGIPAGLFSATVSRRSGQSL